MRRSRSSPACASWIWAAARPYPASFWRGIRREGASAVDLWMSPTSNPWRRASRPRSPTWCARSRPRPTRFPSRRDSSMRRGAAWTPTRYFGTDELYLDHLSRFVRPNGSLGVVLVGSCGRWARRLRPLLRAHQVPQSNGKVSGKALVAVQNGRASWRSLWSGSPMKTDVAAAAQPDGWRHWRDSNRPWRRRTDASPRTPRRGR